MAGRHRKHKNNQLTTGKYALAGAIASIGIATFAVNSGSASAATDDEWNSVAKCESSNNWNTNTGNGFYGGLQFKQSTWQSYGGSQFAQRADLASRSQQIAIAEKVLHAQGKRAWPVCGRSLTTIPYTGLPSRGYTSVLPGPETQNGQYATGFVGLIQTANHAINQAIDGLIQSHTGAPGFAVTPKALPAPRHAVLQKSRVAFHPSNHAVHNTLIERHRATNGTTRVLDSQIIRTRQDPPPPFPYPTYPPLNQVPPPGGFPPGRHYPPHPGRRFPHPDPHHPPRVTPHGPHAVRPAPRSANEHPIRPEIHQGNPVPPPHRYVPNQRLQQVPAPNPANSIFSLQGNTPNINPNAIGDVLNALGAANAHIDPQMLFSNPGKYIPNVGQLLGNNNTNNPAAKGAEGIAQFVTNITNMLGTGPTHSMTNGAPLVPGIGPRN